MKTQYYNIAEQYTRNPGARYIKQGDFSGEDFREKVLEPFFKSYEEGNVLEINLDGLNGYPSSFLEEAFGGIARRYGVEKVKKSLKLICTENHLVVDDIKSYIEQKRK